MNQFLHIAISGLLLANKPSAPPSVLLLGACLDPIFDHKARQVRHPFAPWGMLKRVLCSHKDGIHVFEGLSLSFREEDDCLDQQTCFFFFFFILKAKYSSSVRRQRWMAAKTMKNLYPRLVNPTSVTSIMKFIDIASPSSGRRWALGVTTSVLYR